MNDFLGQVWLGNTVRAYLIVIAVILFILLVKRYVARYVAGLIYALVHRIWKDVDKSAFKTLVVKPLGFFLVVLVSLTTLYSLHFPEELNIDLYRLTVKQLFHTTGTLILIISFFRLLLRIIDFVAMILHIKASRTHDTTDDQLIVFFKDFFKVLLGIIGLLMVLKFAFGFNVGNVLTGLSIVGAAVALALRESLENLIASFIIFFDRPFSTGDIVKVNTFTGTVEKIGLRSTRIRTDQKTYISVPNKQMVDTIIDNLSMRTQRRADLRLELGLSTTSADLDKLLEGIRQIVGRREIESSTVLLSEITSSAYIVTAEYYTGPVTMNEFNTVKQEVNFAALRLLESLGIEIAGASTDVRLMGEGNRQKV